MLRGKPTIRCRHGTLVQKRCKKNRFDNRPPLPITLIDWRPLLTWNVTPRSVTVYPLKRPAIVPVKLVARSLTYLRIPSNLSLTIVPAHNSRHGKLFVTRTNPRRRCVLAKKLGPKFSLVWPTMRLCTRRIRQRFLWTLLKNGKLVSPKVTPLLLRVVVCYPTKRGKLPAAILNSHLMNCTPCRLYRVMGR